jgi:hypothetical protein
MRVHSVKLGQNSTARMHQALLTARQDVIAAAGCSQTAKRKPSELVATDEALHASSTVWLLNDVPSLMRPAVQGHWLQQAADTAHSLLVVACGCWPAPVHGGTCVCVMLWL